MIEDWKIVASAVRGNSHVVSEMPLQDAFAARIVETSTGEKVLLAAISDGAGSAKFAERAARAACDHFLAGAASLFKKGGKIANLNREFFVQFANSLRNSFSVENENLNEFACTFLAAAAGENETILLQIGDGAIVYSIEPDVFRLFAAPQQGEYANSTNFITDETFAERMQLERIENGIQALAMFSDGLQRVALDLAARQPHEPFFRSMFAPLRRENESAAKLEKSLSEFLDSPKINERTDDDKTLILALRRAKDENRK